MRMPKRRRASRARIVASRRLLSLWSGIVALAFLLLPGVANAQFNQTWTGNVQGDILIAGNTLLSCALTGEEPTGNCADVLAGDVEGSNASFTMRYIDVDDDDATENSSSATLNLPLGAEVLHAALVWGGSPPAGTDPSNPDDLPNFESALLDTPAPGGYEPVTASTVEAVGSAYQAIADVTSLVAEGAAGEYTLANAFLRNNSGNIFGGWALLVAYADPSEPWRNLSIYTGFGPVAPGNPGSFTLDDFVTPPAPAPVNAAMGAVVYDGDSDADTDRMFVNGTELDLPPHAPAGNFFRSRITDLGGLVEDRVPAAVNNLGFEWKLLDVSDLIENGDTSAQVDFTTQRTGEQYMLGAFTAAIQLFAPDVQVEKSVENLSRPGQAWPGDVLEYTIEVRNGDDPQAIVDVATDVVVTDPIPAGTTYVPGSLEQVDGEPAPPGERTDDSADDSAERIFGPDAVRFRIGTGANASDGGSLGAGEGATVRFRVRVNDDHAGGAIENLATVSYVAETLDEPFSESDDATVNVQPTADLAIRKRAVTKGKPVPGKLYTYELEVTNNGPATGFGTVLDTLPGKKVTYVADNGGCDTAGLPQLTCDVGPLAVGESHTIRIRVRVKPSAKGALKNTASVTSGNTPDTDPSNNQDSTTRKLNRLKPRLALRKQAGVKAAHPGDVVPYKITVRNRGKGAARNVRVCDVLPAGLAAVRAPGAAKRSAERVCWRLGRLAAGAKRTLRITAQVAMGARAGKLRNTAVANARNARRASDTSPITVRSGPSGPCPVIARC